MARTKQSGYLNTGNLFKKLVYAALEDINETYDMEFYPKTDYQFKDNLELPVKERAKLRNVFTVPRSITFLLDYTLNLYKRNIADGSGAVLDAIEYLYEMDGDNLGETITDVEDKGQIASLINSVDKKEAKKYAKYFFTFLKVLSQSCAYYLAAKKTSLSYSYIASLIMSTLHLDIETMKLILEESNIEMEPHPPIKKKGTAAANKKKEEEQTVKEESDEVDTSDEETKNNVEKEAESSSSDSGDSSEEE